MDRQPMLSPPGNSNVYEPEHFDIVATFGAAALASYFGREVTFERTAEGEFTLTFPQTYRALTKFSANFQLAAGTALVPVIKADNVSTTGKLVIETRSGGAATDPANGSKLFISVSVSRNFLNDQHMKTVA